MKYLISKPLIFTILLCLVSTLAYSQKEIEVRFQPKDYVYVYETKGVGSVGEIFTSVIQNIAVINIDMDSISLNSVELMAISKGVIIQKVLVSQSHLIKSAKKYSAYQDQGILDLYDFQFQTSRYLDGIKISNTTSLKKNEALIISHRALLFQTLPDSIQVVVNAVDHAGNPIKGRKSIAVVNHKSKNEYHLPLKGTWFAGAAPSLNSHHRWGSIQEFAFDFVKTGANGKTFRGEGNKLSDYYAYGEPVYSIGEGKVVSISDGAYESDNNLKQPEETVEEYLMRSSKYQQELLSKGFANVLGNHVIIQHEGGEYSYYVHLKTGSLKVQVGDVVTRGQQIGELGHSGNSTEPHLHFHLTDGPDMSYSRSIPVSFRNITLYPDDNKEIRHIHYGQIVITND